MTTQTISRARVNARAPGAETKSASKPRLAYVDNLRVVLVVLVLLHHLAITYGAEGGWYYRDPQTDVIASIVLTLFVAVNQAFFMGFYFLIAGYFTSPSYDRKGARRFLQERLTRLGIPLLFYTIVISPLLSFALAVNVQGFQGSLKQYLASYLESWDGLDVGPLWFVEALLIFTIIYALWRSKLSADLSRCDGKAPSNLAIGVFALVAGLVTFVVRIWLPVGWSFAPLGFQFPHFPQYISLFILGILAYRRGWLQGITDAAGKLWQRIVVALIVLAPILYAAGGALEGNTAAFRGGVCWQACAYALWEQFLCVGMVISLLVWFRKRRNDQGGLAKALSANAYAVYTIHAPIAILVALALRDISLYPLIKFALACLVTLPFCFLIGHFVRKLPLAKSVL